MQQFVAFSFSMFATIATHVTPNQPLIYLGILSDHIQLCMQPNFGFLSFGALASIKQDPNLFMKKKNTTSIIFIPHLLLKKFKESPQL